MVARGHALRDGEPRDGRQMRMVFANITADGFAWRWEERVCSVASREGRRPEHTEERALPASPVEEARRQEHTEERACSVASRGGRRPEHK